MKNKLKKKKDLSKLSFAVFCKHFYEVYIWYASSEVLKILNARGQVKKKSVLFIFFKGGG